MKARISSNFQKILLSESARKELATALAALGEKRSVEIDGQKFIVIRSSEYTNKKEKYVFRRL